ncbi:uncharacterized protein LOC134185032 [Corticium candelabrum]|uniref:uncharacterized protein LOC134185032 n=1 Tax=Corticium candelabrum TaxID=121492 RepID=UPI002E336347|nr:uncharacterized protein LOC134185032 [Corticium candelabrum]
MAADASDPNHPDSMVKKLFGRSKAEEKVMEAIKLRALELCHEKHMRLIRCFKSSWTGSCSEEHKDFTSCFHTHRDGLIAKYMEKRAQKLKEKLEKSVEENESRHRDFSRQSSTST